MMFVRLTKSRIRHVGKDDELATLCGVQNCPQFPIVSTVDEALPLCILCADLIPKPKAQLGMFD